MLGYQSAGKKANYNEKTDIWSLGCILYELCTGKLAYKAYSEPELRDKIINSEPPELSHDFPEELNYLLKRLNNL